MKNLLFIFSNRRGKIKQKVLKVLDDFKNNNPAYRINIVITEHPYHLTEAIYEFAEKYNKGIVFVAGGDGSLNEAVNALMSIESQIALCPLPFGTANDFCRLLYDKFNIQEFLLKLGEAKITLVDVLKLSG